jgi:hypothetical protein|tara:strand:- start:734 stop:1132 length:399 start_codon:yes stop_codon:yes gene_type:complete
MRYTLKVWLFTGIISPLFIALVLGIFINKSKFDSIFKSYEIIFLMILFGLILSLPSMILFYLIKRNLRENISNWLKKSALSVYSFLSVWLTFYIVDKGFITKWSEQTIWVLIYSITIVLGIWILKIPKSEIN